LLSHPKSRPGPEAAPAARRRPAPAAARLLELDPALGEGVPADELAEARARAVVPLVTVGPGPVAFERLFKADDPLGPFAVLVTDGLIARDVSLLGRPATQLVGPGDVLMVGDPADAVIAAGCATRCRVAVLERRFLTATQQWPWLTARIIERAASWADRSMTQQAIIQLGRVDLRLLFMLGHLAERWGRVTSDGVFVPLRLTHETLGRLVGAQRSTVTLALKELREQGAVVKRGEGWLIVSGAGGSLPLDKVEDASHRSLALAHHVGSAEGAGGNAGGGVPDGTLNDHLTRIRAGAEEARVRARASRERARVTRESPAETRSVRGLEQEDLEGAGGPEDDLAVVGEDAAAGRLLDGADGRL
jgi:CRP/FNR family transcriptional regulator, cyclic AMP receptor protein